MTLKNWLINVALKKAAARGVKAGVASIIAFLTVAEPHLDRAGIDISVNEKALTTGLAAGVVFAYEFFRNWLKEKQGVKVLP